MRSVVPAIAIVLVLITSPAFAQATGQINGVVTDSSGGVVPGATVTAVEQQTGLSRDTVSGANGLYTFPSLRPTVYEIRAVLTGFRTIRRTGIELAANQNLTVNVTLELGELSETVSVAGEAANVDLTIRHDQRGRRSRAHRRAAAERPRRGETHDAGRGHRDLVGQYLKPARRSPARCG